jgi:AraC-like DNA-binding protein
LLKLLAEDFFRRGSQSVQIESRAPQEPFPLHDHDFCEVVIVASGNGWHVLNGEPHLLSCGEVFYLRAGDQHAFEEVHDLYLTNVLYRHNDRLLAPARVDPFLTPANRKDDGALRYWQISEQVQATISALVAAIERESQRPDAASDAMAEALFIQLLVTLWRDRLQHPREPLDLDDVADQFGFTPRTFRRIFREATATTPHGYLIKLRLEHAMRALRATDDKVTEIAFASGFNDANHFSASFSKLIGMSPSRYRATMARRDASQPT